jgi:hypothetical protein
MPANKAKERRGARPVHLWQMVPDQEPGKQVRQISRIDRRTTLGKLLKTFHADLCRHVTEKNGRPPDAVEVALINQCVTLRVKLAKLDQKIVSGDDGDLAGRQYIAWANTFRRSLAALNYGELAALLRRNSEAKLLREYNRG